jgi:hypothetical protein
MMSGALADWRWYRVVFDGLRGQACPVVENVNIPVVPFFSETVSCYVHVSDYVKRAFGHGDSCNITIHPGSDVSFFSRPPDSVFEDDTIGMIYRLDGDKVDERAIDVFLEVVARRPCTRVLIVGGGHHLDAYQARVREAGLSDAFTFPGYVSYYDLPAWLERMSVFVAPVHTESFGQVGPFAMAMELPVAGYAVGALEEITATGRAGAGCAAAPETAADIPPVGLVRFGSLRRLSPSAATGATTAAVPIDRYYITGFLDRHRQDVHGRVLEIAEDVYAKWFGDDRVTHIDILEYRKGRAPARHVRGRPDGRAAHARPTRSTV